MVRPSDRQPVELCNLGLEVALAHYAFPFPTVERTAVARKAGDASMRAYDSNVEPVPTLLAPELLVSDSMYMKEIHGAKRKREPVVSPRGCLMQSEAGAAVYDFQWHAH